ncbi:MAG: Smr/MutS family protein [Flavobacteriaceae bacterium]
MKKISTNMLVSVIDEPISGVVTKIHGTEITIETTEGFEMVFQKSELVPNHGFSEKELSKGIGTVVLSEKNNSQKRKTSTKPKKGVQPPMEVDLHIEQLVKNPKQFSNFEILNVQMDMAKHKLEFAIQKKIQKVVFIHGVGEGVLRAELEYFLNRYEELTYRDADYQKYGNGALEVYIPQKAME